MALKSENEPPPSNWAFPVRTLLICSELFDAACSKALLQEKVVGFDLWTSEGTSQNGKQIEAVFLCSFSHCYVWLLRQFSAIPPGLASLLRNTSILKVGFAVDAQHLRLLGFLTLSDPINYLRGFVAGWTNVVELNFKTRTAKDCLLLPTGSKLDFKLKTDFERFQARQATSHSLDYNWNPSADDISLATSALTLFSESDESNQYYGTLQTPYAYDVPTISSPAPSSTHSNGLQTPKGHWDALFSTASSSAVPNLSSTLSPTPSPSKPSSIAQSANHSPYNPVETRYAPFSQNASVAVSTPATPASTHTILSHHASETTLPRQAFTPSGGQLDKLGLNSTTAPTTSRAHYDLLCDLATVWNLSMPRVRLEQDAGGPWGCQMILPPFLPPATGLGDTIPCALNEAAHQILLQVKESVSALQPPQTREDHEFDSSSESSDLGVDYNYHMDVLEHEAPNLVLPSAGEAKEPEKLGDPDLGPVVTSPVGSPREGIDPFVWNSGLVINAAHKATEAPKPVSSVSAPQASSSAAANPSHYPNPFPEYVEELPIFQKLLQVQKSQKLPTPRFHLSRVGLPEKRLWQLNIEVFGPKHPMKCTGGGADLTQAVEHASVCLIRQYWSYFSPLYEFALLKDKPNLPAKGNNTNAVYLQFGYWDAIFVELLNKIDAKAFPVTLSLQTNEKWDVRVLQDTKYHGGKSTSLDEALAIAIGKFLGRHLSSSIQTYSARLPFFKDVSSVLPSSTVATLPASVESNKSNSSAKSSNGSSTAGSQASSTTEASAQLIATPKVPCCGEKYTLFAAICKIQEFLKMPVPLVHLSGQQSGESWNIVLELKGHNVSMKVGYTLKYSVSLSAGLETISRNLLDTYAPQIAKLGTAVKAFYQPSLIVAPPHIDVAKDVSNRVFHETIADLSTLLVVTFNITTKGEWFATTRLKGLGKEGIGSSPDEALANALQAKQLL